MSHTTKVGLWLVPWFPLLIFALAIYLHFQTPEYTVVSVIKTVPDASGLVKSVSVKKPPFALHVTPISVVSWILLAMFFTGVVFLLVSVVKRFHSRPALKV